MNSLEVCDIIIYEKSAPERKLLVFSELISEAQKLSHLAFSACTRNGYELKAKPLPSYGAVAQAAIKCPGPYTHYEFPSS